MELTALGTYCDITSAKRIYAEEYVEDGIPFYRGKEIIEKSKDQDISEPLFISEERFEQLANKFGAPKPGDILLTSVGTLGVPYVVQDSDRFYFKDGNLTWLRNFSDKLNARYLYYWLTSDFGKQPLLARAIGSSQGAITIEILRKYKIYVPDRNRQDKIVEVLSTYDNQIKINNKRIKFLDQTAEEIYKEWFVRFRFPGYEDAEFENGIPKGWEFKKIDEMYNTTSGGTPSRSHDNYYADGTIPWVKTGELLNNFVIKTEEHITEEGLKNSSAKMIKPFSLLCSMYAGVGKLGINVLPITCSQATCVFTPKKDISIWYLFYWLLENKGYLGLFINKCG